MLGQQYFEATLNERGGVGPHFKPQGNNVTLPLPSREIIVYLENEDGVQK
jgi:hypothetical protein